MAFPTTTPNSSINSSPRHVHVVATLHYGTRVFPLQGSTAFLSGRVTSGDVVGMDAVIKLMMW